jgi:hypothetical protein
MLEYRAKSELHSDVGLEAGFEDSLSDEASRPDLKHDTKLLESPRELDGPYP